MIRNRLTIILNERVMAFKAKYENEKWYQNFKLLPEALAMAKDFILGKYKKLPIRSIIAIIVGLGYFLLPIDGIPDYIPVVGKIDDKAVLKIMLKFIKNDVISYISWKKSNVAAIESP